MMDNYKDLIGQEIGILDEDGHEYKKIVVKAVKKLGSSYVFSDENGDMYGEEELKFTYSLTPLGCFYTVIKDYSDKHKLNIPDSDIDEMFKEFAKVMKAHGHVREDEE